MSAHYSKSVHTHTHKHTQILTHTCTHIATQTNTHTPSDTHAHTTHTHTLTKAQEFNEGSSGLHKNYHIQVFLDELAQ